MAADSPSRTKQSELLDAPGLHVRRLRERLGAVGQCVSDLEAPLRHHLPDESMEVFLRLLNALDDLDVALAKLENGDGQGRAPAKQSDSLPCRVFGASIRRALPPRQTGAVPAILPAAQMRAQEAHAEVDSLLVELRKANEEIARQQAMWTVQSRIIGVLAAEVPDDVRARVLAPIVEAGRV